MSRHPDVPFWLCPGDVASDDGRYPTPAAPLYWIKGNNEDFTDTVRENVRSIGLDQAAASYLILEVDGESLEYQRFTKV